MLAVVVCGLALSQVNPRLVAALTRVRSRAFWQLSAFLLNASLFVLVGLQLRGAVENLVSYSIADAVGYALLISAVVIGTRLLWMYTIPYLIRVLDRRPQQRLRRLQARHRLPIAWSGFRGGVSLAAALAVPATMVDESAFPGRDLIIVITFGVILVTMLAQGLTLPAVLRWSRLPDDEAEQAEQQPASTRSPRQEYQELHAALLAPKRAALVRLRDAQLIDDIVLRRAQARLDAEEVRLSPTLDHEPE